MPSSSLYSLRLFRVSPPVSSFILPQQNFLPLLGSDVLTMRAYCSADINENGSMTKCSLYPLELFI
eukprot:SAG22_NODE_12779_length_429_cov_1.727273_1_plen_65_part_10